jgi:hypothetical protein
MLDQGKLFNALHSLEKNGQCRAREEIARAVTYWERMSNDEAHAYCNGSSLLVPSWNVDMHDRACVRGDQCTYHAVAVDGSQIYPDRHEGLAYALINVGGLYVHYKDHNSVVEFFDEPYVYNVRQEHGSDVSADEIDCYRHELELKTACYRACMHEKRCGEKPLVLCDGSLIFWHLENKPALKEKYLERYCRILTRFYDERVLLVHYISRPANTELMHIVHCADSDYSYRTIVDADLMERVLMPHERSILFFNHASIVRAYPIEMRPAFFYIHTGYEVARVEMPYWLANDPLYEQVETMIVDQINKGEGYPILLAEAHERAVIRTSDRRIFCRMVEQIADYQTSISRKLYKKRRPLV